MADYTKSSVKNVTGSNSGPKGSNPKDENGKAHANGHDDDGNAEYDPNNFEAEQDAKTLSDAQAIQGDPNRHQKAIAHIAHQKKQIQATHQANTRAAAVNKIGKKMKTVFGASGPEGDDEEGQQQTPFVQAAGKHTTRNN